MRISFVEISGFRGFKEKTRLDFPAGFAVITGRNGAGKSTVLDAVDFALTGTIDKYAVKSAKGGGLDKHIWWVGDGSPSRQCVTIGFLGEDGREFQISRSRDANLQPNIEEIGQVLCDGNLEQNWARTLIQTTLVRDETLASLSLDLPERERFEAVRAAIGGLTGPDYSQRTKKLFKAAEAANVEQLDKLDKVQQELGRTLSELTEARSVAEKQTDVDAAQRLIKRLAPEMVGSALDLSARLRSHVAKRKQIVHTITEAIEQAQVAFQKLDALVSSGKITKEESLSAQIAELTRTRDQAADSMKAAEDAYVVERESNSVTTQWVGLLSHGEQIGLIDGHCPLCDVERTDSQFTTAIASARSRLHERGRRIEDAQNRLALLQRTLAEIDSKLQDAQAIQEELKQLKEHASFEAARVERIFRQHGMDVESSNLKHAQALAFRWQEETAELEHALYILEASGAHDRVIALESRIEKLRTEVDTESVNVTSSEKALDAASQINNAARTVANQVLREQFDTVMPLLKEIYQRLRPHADWREIETNFGGKVLASLNFSVGEGKNPQFLFSSGQRRAAGLAFLLAIHLSRPWVKLDCLLLDDPIQHIDDYRALNLVEVLSSIRRTGRQIIVAVEDSMLADLLCRRLRSLDGQIGRRFELAINRDGSACIDDSKDILPLPNRVLEYSDAS